MIARLQRIPEPAWWLRLLPDGAPENAPYCGILTVCGAPPAAPFVAGFLMRQGDRPTRPMMYAINAALWDAGYRGRPTWEHMVEVNGVFRRFPRFMDLRAPSSGAGDDAV